MGDIAGLVNKMKESNLNVADQAAMVQRMTQGKLSLRDMQEQFKNVLKMGSLSSVMSMIPGLSADMLPKDREQESVARIKKFITIMDSMNAKELDSDGKGLTPPRLERIAKGAGVTPADIFMLTESFKPFQKAAEGMKNMKIPAMGKNGEMPKMPANMNMNDMAKMLPPQMLQQMGGAKGLQNMMKQFTGAMGGGGGGMPSIFFIYT